MKPILATLFYGPGEARRAYRPLFDAWLRHHIDLGLAERIVVFTEREPLPVVCDPRVQVVALDVGRYSAVMRWRQPFDMKGALMCEMLLKVAAPILLLDSDALLQRAESLDLAPVVALGMARDLGALHGGKGISMHLRDDFAHVPKRCAGVAWFGWSEGDGAEVRAELVQQYRAAWHKLLPGGADANIPWEKHLPHLLEQHAWSLVAHENNQPVLPDSWNFPPHLKAYAGDLAGAEAAHVHHYFGHKKWHTLKRPAPKNV